MNLTFSFLLARLLLSCEMAGGVQEDDKGEVRGLENYKTRWSVIE